MGAYPERPPAGLKERIENDMSRDFDTRSTSGKDGGARVFAITSGKGGVGKTSIAVNLAITLSKVGLRVLLIDADMGLANVDLMIGSSAANSIEDVMTGRASIFDALAEGPEGLTVLPAASGQGSIRGMEDNITRFKKELKKLRNAFDFIFIDTGAGISANVIDFVFLADEIVVIMTPEPTAFADAYAMVKLVVSEKSRASVGIVVNIAKSENEAEKIFVKFNEIVRRFLGRDVVYRGSVAQDRVVAEAVMRQIPLALYAGKSEPMQNIRKIARNILGLAETKRKGLFSR